MDRWNERYAGRDVVSTARGCLKVVSSSGWSRLLGLDSVGGPPHRDFADEGGARVSPRCSPDWRGVTLAGVILDLGGEVEDELGSFCEPHWV